MEWDYLKKMYAKGTRPGQPMMQGTSGATLPNVEIPETPTPIIPTSSPTPTSSIPATAPYSKHHGITRAVVIIISIAVLLGLVLYGIWQMVRTHQARMENPPLTDAQVVNIVEGLNTLESEHPLSESDRAAMLRGNPNAAPVIPVSSTKPVKK